MMSAHLSNLYYRKEEMDVNEGPVELTAYDPDLGPFCAYLKAKYGITHAEFSRWSLTDREAVCACWAERSGLSYGEDREPRRRPRWQAAILLVALVVIGWLIAEPYATVVVAWVRGMGR
jgi:hypothetical protein